MWRWRGVEVVLVGALCAAGACGSEPDEPADQAGRPGVVGGSGGGAGQHGGGQGGSNAGDGGSGGADDGGAGEGGTTGESGAAGTGSPAAGSPAGGEGGASGSEVRGVVLDDASGRPLAHRTVSAEGETTLTDAAGAFRLNVRTAPFDITVTEPDLSARSVFLGVNSRELVLPQPSTPLTKLPPNVVDLSGSVSGGGTYPLAEGEFVSLRFLAENADGTLTISPSLGPDFGPMRIAWDGAESITGTLVALRSSVDPVGASHYTGLAIRELALEAGADATLEVELEDLDVGNLSGTVAVPDGHQLSFVERYYQVPFSFGTIPLSLDETQATTFDMVVPDLSKLGGDYCVGAGSSGPFFVTRRCGLTLADSDIGLSLQASPELLEPSDGATLGADTELSWTAFDEGVYRVALVPREPSATTPSVYLFTVETTAVLGSLETLSLEHASGSYDYSVTGYAPYPSLDAALSENGILARDSSERRAGVAESRAVSLAP